MGSGGPELLGLCANDTAGCAAAANRAIQQLMFAPEVGDSGWVGSFAEIAFTATQEDPFITTPYDVGRIQDLDLCSFPIPVSNQYFEYLRFGYGRWPKRTGTCGTNSRRCAPLQAFDRGRFPTFSPIVPPDKIIRVYLTDPGDVGKRVLLQSLDGNDLPRYSLDGTVQITGDMLTLIAPFVDSPTTVNKVTGIAKDITLGPVTFYEVDTVTLDERLILTMQPGETTASYRRYFLSGLPKNCCSLPQSTSTEVQLTAMCQITFVPVRTVTDWLGIPNVEALINKCQSIRFDGMDVPNASLKSAEFHKKAIRLLQGQSVHEYGKTDVAINFAPFGNARLIRQGVGINF